MLFDINPFNVDALRALVQAIALKKDLLLSCFQTHSTWEDAYAKNSSLMRQVDFVLANWGKFCGVEMRG